MNEKDNKLIADFMGKPYDYLICDACGKINPELDNPESGSRVTKCCPRSIGNYGKTYRPDEGMLKNFKYDTSWDWLVPVCKNCFDIWNKITTSSNWLSKLHLKEMAINAAIRDYDINKTYTAVIEFIKWYNLNEN